LKVGLITGRGLKIEKQQQKRRRENTRNLVMQKLQAERVVAEKLTRPREKSHLRLKKPDDATAPATS